MEKTQVPTPIRTSDPTDRPKNSGLGQWFSLNRLSYWLIGVWALVAAAATGSNLNLAEFLERQTQTLFFEMRGPVEPPDEIVILTIDDSSLLQGQFYAADPERYGAMAPIQAWPWQRQAYAIAIDKLVAAGAKAVAVDVFFETPSSYGAADDLALEKTLQQHGQRVVLAGRYNTNFTPQGSFVRWAEPLAAFREQVAAIGSVNMPVAIDTRIHEFGSRYLDTVPTETELEAEHSSASVTTFAEATLQAAQVNYPSPKGSNIFFYGPHQTFQQIPFWYILDADAWQTTLQSGEVFKDKIVLIGTTVIAHQDFHEAPFARDWPYAERLSGVEIQANAMATLLEGRAIAPAIPQPLLSGIVVFIGVAGAGWLISRSKQPLLQLAWAAGIAIIWAGAGFIIFTQGLYIVPTAVPIVAIAVSGLSHVTLGAIREQVRKQQLRNTLKHYAALPIIQEIISQQDDLQDLILEREAAIFGKVLGNRYRVVKVLGTGGFSETYVAEDTQRPSNPPCVVKQLRLISDKPNMLRLMRRLFIVEAETLERLGQHSQIPQLLAYFEEDQEFYLVQELIIGRSLHSELLPRRPIPAIVVIEMLQDLLPVLDFIHHQGVIHRDIKPVNVIRRAADQKLVLIDFGIAKKISTQMAESDPHTKFTIGLGTQGYMPSEQAAGMPNFTSDIYALGITAIEALTGTPPHQFQRDGSGQIIWSQQPIGMSSELEHILRKMVHHDYSQRYQSAQEVTQALEQLPEFTVNEFYKAQLHEEVEKPSELKTLDELGDLDADTQLWQSE